MSGRIMHIDLDAFFVSVERRNRPDLDGKPVVVGGNPDRRGVVAAASYEARKFGIRSGMPLKTAVRLCPKAIFISGSHQKYREVSRQFFALLGNYSPFIEPVSIDEAYLDVTGFESIHGSIAQMGEKIRRSVREQLDLTASIGIAGSKTVAKVASEKAKPDGLLEVLAGEEAGFLAPLEINCLPGIGTKTESILKKLGVTSLGRLAKMPPGSLRLSLGSYGDMLIRSASGIDERKVEPPAEAKSISRENTFTQDTRDSSTMQSMLAYLSERVGADLRKRNKYARCITIKLRFNDFNTLTRSQTMSQPSDADQVIFSTGLKLFLKELAKNPLPVRLIGIGVTGLTEKGGQLSMLEQDTLRMEKLNRAVDRIRVKYGFGSIQTGRTLRLEEIFPAGLKSKDSSR
ncbi:MAG: DNA polymerase IV [Dehalococcoidales bacterium]|nr:DNA polymerase IV [Dehalococcoidales bacterium]MDX9803009.1 DNA polymerase IV [Dehalococcoidales bacterium]